MAFTYNQVTSITHDMIKDVLSEGVFLSNEFTARLRKNQELEEGGNKILLPLMTVDDTGSTGAFFAPRDNLSLSEYDGFSASAHDWKYLHESIVIYKADIAKNAGKLGVLKLIDKKIRQAELALNQRLVKGALSDGTSDQFVGIRKIIAASGSYGGISSTDLASWISYIDSNSGSTRAITQALVDKTYDQATEQGIGGPTLGLMNKAVMTKFKGLLTAFQRTLRENTVNGLGHDRKQNSIIVYNGCDHMIENNMPNTSASLGSLWYIDEDKVKLHVHKDHNMRKQSISDLETADALLERIFLYANICASERKFCSELTDLTI